MKSIVRIAFAMAMMVVLPATTLAGGRYARLTVHAVPNDIGTVAVVKGNNGNPTDFGATKSADNSVTQFIGTPKEQNLPFTVSAQPADDYVFGGWYENEECTGEPISMQAEKYVYNVYAESTKSGSPTEGFLYAKFIQHVHEFAYSINGDTITKTCTVAGCPYEGGVAGTATLTANDAVYTGKAYAASVTKTGDIAAELSYSTETAPIDVGEYSVTMKVDGGEAENTTLTKQFTISAAEITALTLDPTSFNYDGTAKTVSIKSVKAGTLTLAEGDYDISGDAMTQIGSLAETTTWTVTVTGKGNYTGTASATWTIKAPTGEFDADALSASPGCTADGNTVTMTDSTALTYNPETLKYSAAMTVTWPAPKTTSYTLRDYGTATYIDAPHAFVAAPNDATYSGSQVLDVAVETPGLSATTGEGQYDLSLVARNKKFTYFDSMTFMAEFTAEEVATAIAEQKTSFDYSMTVWSIAWKGGDEDTCGSDTGIKPTTYTMTIPLEGIILNDENGNQVYPHVDFVAQNGLKKFATLGAALEVVDEGETVTLIAAAEVDAFEVPAGATLDLVGFGNAEATYEIGAIEDKSAIIKSIKEESVEAVTGYEVDVDTTTEPGVYIYTAKLAHTHSWTFEVEEDGITLTATCENPSCTIEEGTLQLQLQGVEDKAYDGSGISPAIVDIEKEGYKFREVIEGVTVGEITYERPEYSAGKWYTGAYTASCVVTIDETPYTLTKDFEITKPEGGYTSGFEAQGVGGYDVRFDTFLEATGVANEGDTIYYKGGNLTGKDVTFSSSKDITLDLGGKSLKHDAYESSTLTNGGAGTVTLTNGTIVQPKGLNAAQMSIEGNFAFADIKALNRATNGGNFLTFTVKSGTVTILDGKYTAEFKADGGEVVYQGGQFWDGKYESWGSDRYQFTKPTPAEGYIVIPGEEKMDDGNGTSRDLVWKIVAHTHEIVYSAAGNVITATCDAEDHEYCGYGEETLTLKAEDRQATGLPYAGASIEYSEGFPMKEAEIVYFAGDEELEGAPTEVGEYIAKVTVEDATAEAPFAITHIHTFEYNALNAMTIGVKCVTEMGACDFKDWKTATLTAADTKTFDGAPYAATFELGEGFPTDYVTISLEYGVKNGEKLEDAPSAVGEYTVKMIASEGDTTKYTLEKDFKIVPADLAGATITLSQASFDFDGYEKSVTISSVKFGEMTLVEGVDYEISEDSVFNAAGEGRVDETFTIKLEGIDGSNFAGEATATWKIVAGKERDDFKFGAGTAGGEYGEVTDKTMTVTDSTKLVYNGDGTWSMAMNIAMPIDGNVGEHFVPTIRLYFRNPETGEIVIASNDDDCKNIGVAITSAKTLVGDYYYITKVVWTEKISLDEIEDAILAGDDKIVRTMKMWSPKWEQEIIRNILTYDNHDGLPVTEYKMELPLADLVLPVAADTELRTAGTLFATDEEFDAYMLTLGKGAKVYGDPTYEDEDGYLGYLPNEDLLTTDVEGYNVGCDDSDESNIFYTTVAKKYNLAYEFVDEDGNALDGVTNPYASKKTYTIEDEIIFSEAATLDGYEFIEWSPAKIEKGTTGKQTIVGSFKKAAILPTAEVKAITAEGYEAAVEFTAKAIGQGYEDWTAEFVLTADVAIGADEIKLGGQYDAYSTEWIDIAFPGCEADQPISVLGLVGYNDITIKTVFDTIQSFKCGVKNIALKNDAIFTLKLIITNGEDTKEICSIGELEVKAKAIEPVVPGDDIIVPAGKDADEYAAEIEAQKATLLKAPITLVGDELTTYQSYFTAKAMDATTVQFVLNELGEAAVAEASAAAKRETLELALTADATTLTLSAPLKGFYYSLKQGANCLTLDFNVDSDKNKIGETISFELIKPENMGFYQMIITSTPYEEM